MTINGSREFWTVPGVRKKGVVFLARKNSFRLVVVPNCALNLCRKRNPNRLDPSLIFVVPGRFLSGVAYILHKKVFRVKICKVTFSIS
jgi:hypothetical protein